MKKQIGILLLAGIVTTISLQAQNLSLSLSQAKSQAVSNNLSIKNAQLAVLAAQKNVQSTIAKGLPQAEASFDYSHFFNYEMNLSFGSSGGEATIDYTKLDVGDLEILKMLESSMGSPEPIVMKGSMSSKIQVSQILFSGQYWVGIQMAKLAQLMNEQNVEKTRSDIEESVSNVYFGILVLEESLGVLGTTIQNLQETQTRTAAMVRAGMAESTDTSKLKMAVNNLINNKKQLERTVSFNYSMLKFLLGVSQQSTITLTEPISAFVDESNIAGLLLKPFSVEQVDDYKLLESQEMLAQKSITLEKMSFAPTAVAFYNYNYKIISTDFDMNPDHIAGVSVKIPLLSSGSRSLKVQEAKIKYEQAQNTKSLVAQQLQIKEKQARYDVASAYENYLLQKENIALSLQIYDKIRQKYEYGVASSFELTQANNDYLQAQSNYLNAYMQLLQAKTALEKLL
ncbi:MAG TPA: TolC family protein [Bacteroidales bacterium]|nr:TolC family protein [Bacteroidales bacterium]HPM13185.1 TolC family protein [Bacteroidales bacterium]